MSADRLPGGTPFPFVVARGRSGTTLLRAMLDAHPQLAVPGESHFVAQFATRRRRYETPRGFDQGRFVRDIADHWAFRRWRLPAGVVPDALAASPPVDLPAAIRTVYRAYADAHGKERYGDKTPSYVLNIDLIAKTLPEAVFIHLIRDGRDVALSYLETDFGVRTLGQAAIHWDRFVRAGRSAGARIGPERYLEVRYEELVAEPERVLTRVCGFVDLPYDESMLRYHERADALITDLSHADHHQNLLRPPTVGLRDWRHQLSGSNVAVFEALAGDLLDELGYERSGVRPGIGSTLSAWRFRRTTEARRAIHGAYVRGRRLRRRLKSRVAGGSRRRAALAERSGVRS